MPLILEGLVTTENADGTVNVSPMGPIVDKGMSQLTLRPYETSLTYTNLKRTGRGLFHVTDDVEMIAKAAIGRLSPTPAFKRHDESEGWILADACRWYAFDVEAVDESSERKTISCSISDRGRMRDFFGFNRAKHAVLEAAILATRTSFLPAEEIFEELERLSVIVDKTAGEQEERAFRLLRAYIDQELSVTSKR